jgi:hypothetical protein
VAAARPASVPKTRRPDRFCPTVWVCLPRTCPRPGTRPASPLIANRTAIGAWEQFDLLSPSSGNIALRAHANNMYVTADNAGASPLIANRTAIGTWEQFDLITD